MNTKLIQQHITKYQNINNSNANIFIIQMQISPSKPLKKYKIVKIENELLNNSFEFRHVNFSKIRIMNNFKS